MPGLAPSSSAGLNGRYSKQSSLSIQSASGNLRASPSLVPKGGSGAAPVPSGAPPSLTLKQPQQASDPISDKLPRQESSFTQEEIYR